MNHSYLRMLLIFVVISLSASLACTKDVCRGVRCINRGACVDGNCICQLGYESVDCSQQTRKHYEGEFTGDGNDQKLANYHSWHFNFVAAGDSALKMNLQILDSARTFSWNMQIRIEQDLRTFKIIPGIVDNRTISGSGTLGAQVTSVEFQMINKSISDTLTYTFNDNVKL